MSNALKTDKYELTMLEAYLQNGMENKKAVFELFGRKLPPNRKFGIVGGTARALEAIKNFKFDDEDLEYLAHTLNPRTIEYLENYRFSGNVYGYAEGDYWFPYAPLLTVEAPLGEAVILETLLLSIFNYDSAVASSAAHMRHVAPKALLMEFGARRVNEDAAVAASRAAYMGGFNMTSNLEAGRKYGVPVSGTAAHAFTLSFPTEKEAFEAQIKTFGTNTTLLVDTYDILRGVQNAIEVAGPNLGGVRIDSGDPYMVIPQVRELLNKLGARDTKIVLSGDVTLENLEDLVNAELPIDSFGIGTDVVTGSGAVASGFVYKLVEVEQNGTMVPVAKKSAGGKNSKGGRKYSIRMFNDNSVTAEHHYLGAPVNMKNDNVPLQHVMMEAGEITHTENVTTARERVLDNLLNHPVTTKPVVKVDVGSKENAILEQVW